MKKMNKKGFTIVELSIVIAVIAILSAVLIPTFTGIVKDAKKNAAIENARIAYQEYLFENAESENDPAEDFIYKADDKYVVIKDGKIDNTKLYADELTAVKEFDNTVADATTADAWTEPVEEGSSLYIVADPDAE